jgi:hypothetical protein
MARAFVRAKERFAFSTAQEIPQWKQLGIRPVVFPKRRAPRQFGAIDDALKAWIERTRMGLFDVIESFPKRCSPSIRVGREFADGSGDEEEERRCRCDAPHPCTARRPGSPVRA